MNATAPPSQPETLPPMVVSTCADNLEGDGPTNEERAENHRALMKMHRGNRFRLMFGLPMLPAGHDHEQQLERSATDA